MWGKFGLREELRYFIMQYAMKNLNQKFFFKLRFQIKFLKLRQRRKAKDMDVINNSVCLQALKLWLIPNILKKQTSLNVCSNKKGSNLSQSV